MSTEDDAAIADEFAESWLQVEAYYLWIQKPEFSPWMYPRGYGQPTLALLNQMQQAGYDRLFRAGQQLSTLILSRARRHGLRNDQPRITIREDPEGVLYLRFSSGNPNTGETVSSEEITLPDATLTPEFESLLQRLANYPID